MAIVTGSTAGLGREIARRFAAEGADVVVTGRDTTRGESVARDIHATFVAADLTDEDACQALVAAAIAHFGRLTVLVNNAAHTDGNDGRAGDVSTAAWDAVLRVNVTAVMWLCRHALPAMVSAGHGAIVNISSRAAERGTPGLAAYAASKGALNALTRSIAVDYAADGIRCNTISPGYVLNDHRDANLDDDPARRKRLEAMHLTRLATAADVANAAVFLASRESETVTGINLPVDGGSTTARATGFG